MSESKHTPGPWVWDCKNHDNRERPFIRSSKMFSGAERGASICKVTLSAHGYIESEANARLIAAAPELLAAAQLTALHFARNHAGGADQGDDEHEAWTALNKAINAATKGKS